MVDLLDHPFLVFVVSLFVFWGSALLGVRFRDSINLAEGSRGEFMFVLGATLTMLGLIVGFTFSLAVTRYDQRKNYEELEANAIATEYARTDLLPDIDAPKVRSLIASYLEQRILNYTANEAGLPEIEARTNQLKRAMWSTVAAAGAPQSPALKALTLAGMNDVLNSQGFTQAAWRNRIPIAAWVLLAAMAVFCNALIGLAAETKSTLVFLILPAALSISLFLIADIDSPRGGVIRVRPQNLESLAVALHSQ